MHIRYLNEEDKCYNFINVLKLCANKCFKSKTKLVVLCLQTAPVRFLVLEKLEPVCVEIEYSKRACDIGWLALDSSLI